MPNSIQYCKETKTIIGLRKRATLQRLWQKKFLTKYPWARAYKSAQKRCRPSGNYFKRGIKLELTLSDFKLLWHRDKAYNMKYPSIDRINPKLNYTFENCRYLELSDNIKRRAWGRCIHCGQYPWQ